MTLQTLGHSGVIPATYKKKKKPSRIKNKKQKSYRKIDKELDVQTPIESCAFKQRLHFLLLVFKGLRNGFVHRGDRHGVESLFTHVVSTCRRKLSGE